MLLAHLLSHHSLTLSMAPNTNRDSSAFRNTICDGGEIYGKAVGDFTPSAFNCKTTCDMLTRCISGVETFVSQTKDTKTINKGRS